MQSINYTAESKESYILRHYRMIKKILLRQWAFWLYQSKSCYVFFVVISLAALAAGIDYSGTVIAAMMIGMEVALSICLWLEVRQLFLSATSG